MVQLQGSGFNSQFIDCGSSTRNRVPRFAVFDDTLNLVPNLYPNQIQIFNSRQLSTFYVEILSYVIEFVVAASYFLVAASSLNVVPNLYPNQIQIFNCNQIQIFNCNLTVCERKVATMFNFYFFMSKYNASWSL